MNCGAPPLKSHAQITNTRGAKMSATCAACIIHPKHLVDHTRRIVADTCARRSDNSMCLCAMSALATVPITPFSPSVRWRHLQFMTAGAENSDAHPPSLWRHLTEGRPAETMPDFRLLELTPMCRVRLVDGLRV